MGGDSETRFLNLNRKECKESLLPPAEAIYQFLSSNFPADTMLPPFSPAPPEATRA